MANSSNLTAKILKDAADMGLDRVMLCGLTAKGALYLAPSTASIEDGLNMLAVMHDRLLEMCHVDNPRGGH